MVVGQGAAQHAVGGVAAELLGGADKADLARRLLPLQLGDQDLGAIVVLAGLNPMQVEHVDMVRAQPTQAAVKAFGQFGGGEHTLAAPGAGLGRQEDLVAPPANAQPDRLFGAVVAGCVDQGDA